MMPISSSTCAAVGVRLPGLDLLQRLSSAVQHDGVAGVEVAHGHDGVTCHCRLRGGRTSAVKGCQESDTFRGGRIASSASRYHQTPEAHNPLGASHFRCTSTWLPNLGEHDALLRAIDVI